MNQCLNLQNWQNECNVAGIIYIIMIFKAKIPISLKLLINLINFEVIDWCMAFVFTYDHYNQSDKYCKYGLYVWIKERLRSVWFTRISSPNRQPFLETRRSL